MTDTITADPTYQPSPAGAVVLRAMLARPTAKYFCDGLAVAIDRPRGTIRNVLNNLEAAGWLTSETEPRVQYQPRRFFQLTKEGAKLARKEIATWKFTDE